MVDSVVGIKPRAVQLKVWFGINYVLEKKGSSQFLDTSPALQRLTCAWKEDWNLRIHFPNETIKSVDTLSSDSSLCHQETTHVQCGRLWQFEHPRPLSLLQRGLAPRSKGKARAELRPARSQSRLPHSRSLLLPGRER